jgi:UDP-N-acetyl-D-mannosaminuronate dehydrogenase
VLVGILNIPATSPERVVVNRPIEYIDVTSGVVVQLDETVAVLVAALYDEIVLCWPAPIPETI